MLQQIVLPGRRRRLRANGRGIGRWRPRSVFFLQASERRELAPAGGVGLEQTEDVDHLRGAQLAFDRAFYVREREGRVTEMRPAQGLLEEDDLVRVAFEERAIKAIQVVVRDVPERVAQAPVERFREALPGEFVGDELHQRIGEFRLVLGAVPLGGGEFRGGEAGVVSARMVAAGSMGSFSCDKAFAGRGGRIPRPPDYAAALLAGVGASLAVAAS